MAAGTKSNMTIYEAEFYAGFTEVLSQNADAFNAASQGSIRQVTRLSRGDFEKNSFFDAIAAGTLISRRDITSVAAAADSPITMDEIVSPKINRKIGPIAQTNDAWRKVGRDPSEFSFILGQQIAKGVQLDWLNSALRAVEACVDKAATTKYDATDGDLASADLIEGLNLMGDRGNSLVAWVMHSKQYYDLVKTQLAANILNVSDINIKEGIPITLSRPVIVTDSDVLVVSGSPDNYICLGLVAGATEVAESEDREIVTQPVTGLENLVTRIQGEFAYNLTVKGFKFTTTVNPNDAAVASSANWTQAATSVKDGPGVRILSL